MAKTPPTPPPPADDLDASLDIDDDVAESAQGAIAQDAGLIPPEASLQATSHESLDAQAVARARAIIAQHAQSVASGRPLVALPNGEYSEMTDDEMELFDFTAQQHRSLFADIHEVVADPKPGYMYVWAAIWNPRNDKHNARTMSHIRSQRYRVVTLDEAREDSPHPIETMKYAGKDAIVIGDVVLCEVSPQAQRHLYKWRYATARQNTNRWAGFNDLKNKIDSAGRGQALAEIEVR